MPSYPTRPPYHLEHTYFVLPTYACNLRCAHCATSPHGDGVGAMTMDEFSGIVRRLTDEVDGAVELRFIGGEPTIWKHINAALSLAAGTGRLRTSVFSNCTRELSVLPRWLFFAINSWFTSPSTRESAKAVFRSYHDKIGRGFSLSVRYVVTEQSTDDEVREVVGFLRQFPKAGVGVGFDVELFGRDPDPPMERRLAIGQQVIRTLEALGDTVGPEKVRVQDVFPLCLFTDDELARLRQTYLIRGICTTPEASMVFLPGGLVQLCPNVMHRLQVPPAARVTGIPKQLEASCEAVRWAPRERCAQCHHFLARECQGGCLGPSVRAMEAAGVSPLGAPAGLVAARAAGACACQ